MIQAITLTIAIIAVATGFWQLRLSRNRIANILLGTCLVIMGTILLLQILRTEFFNENRTSLNILFWVVSAGMLALHYFIKRLRPH
jgi:lipid-A-disaccharide synthase-like uncharacterized protein